MQLKAEKPFSAPDQLLEEATNVVIGNVKAVYRSTEKEGDWEYTRFIAEVRVEACEKGDNIHPNSLIYVRYWQKRWSGSGSPPPDTIGHHPIPEKNDVVRIYLARNSYDGFTSENTDGGLNVIGVNGFEKFKAKSRK